MNTKEIFSSIYGILDSLRYNFNGCPEEQNGIDAAIRKIEELEKRVSGDDNRTEVQCGIKTVGDLRKFTDHLDNNFEIEMRIRRRLSDEELADCRYPYPYETELATLEFDDIGYSDKVLCLGVERQSEV